MDIADILGRINATIINPLILLLLTLAMAMFIWGIIEFLASDEGGEGRSNGKRNILWGLVGLFIMLSVYGILSIVLSTFGIDTDILFTNSGSSAGSSNSGLPGT